MKVTRLGIAIALNRGELSISFEDGSMRAYGMSVPLSSHISVLCCLAFVFGHEFPASLIIATAAPRPEDAKTIYENNSLTLNEAQQMVADFFNKNKIAEPRQDRRRIEAKK